MKLKEIRRTSTFAWSPTPSLPLLATGTVAGALDESFSNESQLEIWAPDFLNKNEFYLGDDDSAGPKGLVKDTARFNRLAWGYVDSGRPYGTLAAGLENGELVLWDPAKILANASPSESLILRNTIHTGPLRGLDFNPNQKNLLSSGAVNGEVYIWDLKDPSKPYSPTPGTRSTKLDEITAVAWNQHVPSVLAGSSSTGFTVVWDLRGKKEVVALAYGGGAGTMIGQTGGGAGMAMGGRRGMSDIAWHPDNATRLVTASEDDSSPIIMVWDLRNARAPEKILTGHEKGVLSLSWCKQDADLLLSCGKDNRALCWNPQTSEIIGELPSADNWAFQVDWCPRNPDLFAAAFFDGTVGIHSVQSTNETADGEAPPVAPSNGADIFSAPGYSSHATLSLRQPPKWLRRPNSNSFGYGGKLVTVSNLPSAQGKHQSSVVHVRKVVTEAVLVERVRKLQTAVSDKTLKTFAQERSDEVKAVEGADTWKALLSLFQANSRDELITLLGFSKAEVAARVAKAITNLKATYQSSSSGADDLADSTPHQPVVSFLEPEREPTPESDGERDSVSIVEKTPSEISGSAISDATGATQLADDQSTTTVPSLFGDENAIGTPQTEGAADFFSTMGITQATDTTPVIPHHNYAHDSSVAATIGSGPSSVTSESLRSNTFRIYPSDEADSDRLITKALVLGDFESAVSLCLSVERYADAILLAVKGGSDLLQSTQKAYFERRTTTLPYLRLFQSIVANDLADVVQNADLREWQEIFVVLCTFASQEEFANLAEQLGGRLEFQFRLAKSSGNDEERAKEFRKNATLTYLAAGRLERLVNIWIDELAEEEHQILSGSSHSVGSRYAVHGNALQTFIEKVTIFRNAVKYEDVDIQHTQSDGSEVKNYKLSALYERYFEYADLLAAQGLVKEAVAFLNLTPVDFTGPGSVIDFKDGRERILTASNGRAAPVSTSTIRSTALPVPSLSNSASVYAGPYVSPVSQAPAPALPALPSTYGPPYQSNIHPVASANGPHISAGPPVASQSAYSPYTPLTSQSYANPPVAPTVPPPSNAAVPPPPRGTPPSKRQENGGWNDAPVVGDRRPPPSAPNANKPTAITSPFPNASPSATGPPTPSQQPSMLPPPRPGSVQSRPPPPPQGAHLQRPPPGSPYPPPGRPPSAPQSIQPPPTRIMSPPQGPARQPTPSQYLPPPTRGLVPGQTIPSGPYARGTPPPGPPHGGPHVRGASPPAPPDSYRGPAPPSQYFQPPPPGPYSQAPPPQLHPGSSHQQPQGPYNAQGGHRLPPQQQPPLPAPPIAGSPTILASSAPPSRVQRGPPPPKYPPGDRSHIPDNVRPAFNVISELLSHLRRTTPPQQKRMVDDIERRINSLFDALNCSTLSQLVIDQLLTLTRAMEAHDREAALAIHIELLTTGSQTDDIALWMSGVKQLIMWL